MLGKDDKKERLQKLKGMERKRQELIPMSEPVKSAIHFLKELEKFYDDKSHGSISIYPLLAKTFQGIQSDKVAAAISGRLFNEMTCFIAENKEENIQKETKEFSSRNKKTYNFISPEVVEKIGEIFQQKNKADIEGILQNIADKIIDHPAWKTFWKDRRELPIDEELKTKVLQALIYKTVGECHRAYLEKAQPSLKEQQAAQNALGTLKASALTVIPAKREEPADLLTSSSEPLSDFYQEKPRQLLYNTRLPSRDPSSQAASSVPVERQEIAPQGAQEAPVGRVKKLAEAYEQKIKQQEDSDKTSRKRRL